MNKYKFIYYKSTMSQDNKLQLQDLLLDLKEKDPKEQSAASQFLSSVSRASNKKIQKVSKKKHEQIKRKENYNMTKQQLDKWIPIVKANRQKQSINFQQRDQTLGNNVNFFSTKPINSFHQGIEKKLKEMNVGSSKQVLQHQQAILEKLDPQQAQRRLIEARKHRTAIFYEEQKRRRIAKIKSKLYRKIKKKQRMREEAKKIETLDPHQRQQYIQKITKNRIKERITLRHNTKNKHIQNLLRFNKSDKDCVQNGINQLNQIRKKELQKINQERIGDQSEDYDDQNFREQAMKDLVEQINAVENQDQMQEENNGGLSDMKFIQIAKQKRKVQQKKQAKRLLKKLEQSKDGYIDQENLDSDDVEQSEQQSVQEDGNTGRKIYGKSIEGGHNPSQKQSKRNKGIQDQLNKHLGVQHSEELTEGINLEKLKQKYQPQRVEIDLAKLIADNRQIYEGNNQAALENVRQYQQEKVAEYQQALQPEKKPLSGWGSWAGPGIAQKRIDPKQQLRKKLQKIEDLKKKRKDSSLAHVTINETRNKALSDYFVRSLPHNYSNADQFDYMQNEAIGPQWNSMNQYKDNIKPKIKTKLGQVITAAQLPRKVAKYSQNAGYGSQ